ncbi:hypothetical protein ACT3N8_13710 [Psychrobacter aquimaris]|uniref:hypothetical protein n=1 Tax=Psychrobacter aquimaris TaxID=292733 RepID=UPI003FD3C4A3
MEVISAIAVVLVVLALPLILFTYMREDMDVVIVSIALAILITAIWVNWQENKNAEFEAVHCPEMLQIDSSYCKPNDN